MLKSWLFIVGMLLSLSATAGVHSSGFETNNHYSEQVAVNLSDRINNLLVRRTDQDNKPVFVSDTQRSTTHRSVLFLADGQAKPQYQLEFEFSPPDLTNGRYDTSTIATIPWFIQSTKGKTRVSGWKDGNSLYTACITYHS